MSANTKDRRTRTYGSHAIPWREWLRKGGAEDEHEGSEKREDRGAGVS